MTEAGWVIGAVLGFALVHSFLATGVMKRLVAEAWGADRVSAWYRFMYCLISVVTTAIIPGVRGYFYERQEQNLPEDIVTEQLAGLIRASLIKLELLLE